MKQPVVAALRASSIALPPLGLGALCSYRAAPPTWAELGVTALLSLLAVAWQLSTNARRLRTVTSVLAAYREGDFSIRARSTAADPALNEVFVELNHLGDTLRGHRLGEMEAWALLRKVVAEVDVIVLACDEQGRIRLANEAAAKLVGRPVSSLLDKAATDLGIDDLLAGPAPRTLEGNTALPGGPWELRRGTFRLSGEAHTLLVLSDVSFALRQRERDAWRRLVRVIGHEINNSLTPIQSISRSIAEGLTARDGDPEWEQDTQSGLKVIERRAESLARFMQAYAQLARLPEPQLKEVSVAEWVRRVAKLEQRVNVEIQSGPACSIRADSDQLEQMLINLVKNAAEASREQGSESVRLRWSKSNGAVLIQVEDDGAGIANPGNLFVPFFTTKPGGSGIGLALARQIAEAHGGSLTLENRTAAAGSSFGFDSSGAIATVRLPVQGP
ncbi:MAG: GHKL domain-containing protein [Polyangiaceae bacterium]|nr:GHKL domain-containing protein [Polyangiaceae bacterium]